MVTPFPSVEAELDLTIPVKFLAGPDRRSKRAPYKNQAGQTAYWFSSVQVLRLTLLQ